MEHVRRRPIHHALKPLLLRSATLFASPSVCLILPTAWTLLPGVTLPPQQQLAPIGYCPTAIVSRSNHPAPTNRLTSSASESCLTAACNYKQTPSRRANRNPLALPPVRPST
ncbi:uncharacterized protein PSANT_00354 [Moesziomyces antarcticus]|uniref:Uncharacterized protein n=1 Tax=Pseudozyma antarctica TaxID=84753 RepID=A0A5C3FGQ2_PSEA2|nr:uncharacterized protein PSANT_00354 [Moesziomyces antarcticus]